MTNFLRGRIRWLLIFWMFVMSAIAYLDRVNISIAGGVIAREFHLDNVHLGWIFSSFVLGYALFQAPGGRLADRFGPRRIVTLGVVWWGVFTALSASVPVMTGALWIMIGVRFALGMGEAVVYPASNRLVAKWIPSSERGIANGLIFTGVGAGAGVTPPLIRYILENYGWRWSFWFSAVVGLLAGLVWYFIARDIPEEHPWVDRQERELIEAGLPQAPENHDSHRTLPWSAILRSKDLLAMTASYFAYGYAAYIFFTWFFIYLSTVRGLNLKTSSYYAMLPFAAMAIGSLLGGYISDRLTKLFGKRVGRCGIAMVGIGLAGRVHRSRNASRERGTGQHRARRRRRRTLSFAELVLVGDRRSRRLLGRFRFRRDEYGRPNGRSGNGLAQPVDRRPLRMDRIVPDRGRAMRDRVGGVGLGRSGQTVASS